MILPLTALLFALLNELPAAEQAQFIVPPEIFIHHTPERSFIGPGMFALENGDILMAAPWGRPPTNFEQIARRLCVGHAFSCPVRWGCEVEVFGCTIQPGQLIHADKHGFLAVPAEDEARLLEAARFMDANECQTLIPAARDVAGRTLPEICDAIDAAGRAFGAAAKAQFGRKGEW